MWSYSGLGQEVWYPHDTEDSFIVCDAPPMPIGADDRDRRCGIGSVAEALLNHEDHDYYLGHNMWCCSDAQPKFAWNLVPTWEITSGCTVTEVKVISNTIRV